MACQHNSIYVTHWNIPSQLINPEFYGLAVSQTQDPFKREHKIQRILDRDRLSIQLRNRCLSYEDLNWFVIIVEYTYRNIIKRLQTYFHASENVASCIRKIAKLPPLVPLTTNVVSLAESSHGFRTTWYRQPLSQCLEYGAAQRTVVVSPYLSQTLVLKTLHNLFVSLGHVTLFRYRDINPTFLAWGL